MVVFNFVVMSAQGMLSVCCSITWKHTFHVFLNTSSECQAWNYVQCCCDACCCINWKHFLLGSPSTCIFWKFLSTLDHKAELVTMLSSKDHIITAVTRCLGRSVLWVHNSHPNLSKLSHWWCITALYWVTGSTTMLQTGVMASFKFLNILRLQICF